VARGAESPPPPIREICTISAKGKHSTLVRAATAVFGKREAAILWLITRQPALSGRSPLAIAGTKTGHAKVLNLLGAIEDGGYM
jgi:uncharacterized protein (DUF2384 family)